MAIRLDLITAVHRNANSSLKAASMALCHSPAAALGFENVRRRENRCKLSILHKKVPPTGLGLGLGLGLVAVRRRSSKNRSLFSVAASFEESKPSDIDIEKEKDNVKVGVEESEEEWQKTLKAFKEQALKMQSQSKEAYELYSKKAMVILKETSENLKVQAEKARQDLSVIAEEIAEESRGYLATAAENSPEEVKDIVETFASPSEALSDVSKVRDFYVGIPYGALLSLGGFISFMVTGSVPAIRFGIILGGTLLALGISSLRAWKKGESSPLALKGQTAISAILFLRELRLWSMRPFIVNFITTLVSGAVVAFYVYRILRDGKQARGSGSDVAPDN